MREAVSYYNEHDPHAAAEFILASQGAACGVSSTRTG